MINIRISVIIPTYNRSESLKRCLNSLTQQNLEHELWEVIVINDGGQDVEKLIKSFSDIINLHCLFQPNKGPATARNNGAYSAKGEIVVFLDDDCTVDENWLLSINESIVENEILGGRVFNALKSNSYSESSQILLDFLYDYNLGQEEEFFTSNNFALNLSTFHKIGGFNERFSTSAGEDREFCVRAKSKKISLRRNKNMIVYHSHFLTFSTFIKMHIKYGKASKDYRYALSKANINFNQKPKLSFYVKMLFYPFKLKRNPLIAFCYSLLLFISQISVAIGFAKSR